MTPIMILLASALAMAPAIADAKGGKGEKHKRNKHISSVAKHAEKHAKKHIKKQSARSAGKHNGHAAKADRSERRALEREVRRIVQARSANAGLEDILVAQGMSALFSQIGQGTQLNAVELAQYRGNGPAPGDRLISRPNPVPGDRLIGRVIPGLGDRYFDDSEVVTRRDYGINVVPAPREDYDRSPLSAPRDLPSYGLAPLTSPIPRRSIFAGRADSNVETAALDSAITVSPLSETAIPRRFSTGDLMPANFLQQYVALDDHERFGLPPATAGTRYVRVENDAVLVSLADRTVRDVLPLGTLMIQ